MGNKCSIYATIQDFATLSIVAVVGYDGDAHFVFETDLLCIKCQLQLTVVQLK